MYKPSFVKNREGPSVICAGGLQDPTAPSLNEGLQLCNKVFVVFASTASIVQSPALKHIPPFFPKLYFNN